MFNHTTERGVVEKFLLMSEALRAEAESMLKSCGKHVFWHFVSFWNPFCLNLETDLRNL